MEVIKNYDKWTFCATTVVATILCVCCASGENGNVMKTLFTRIYVPSYMFPFATKKEEFPIFNKLACLQQAQGRGLVHLACFSNDGICSFYDLNMTSNYRTMEKDLIDFSKCYTDLPKVCASDNQFYAEDDKCARLTCSDKSWTSIDGAGHMYRVGIYDDEWMDGRTPDPGSWLSGEPNSKGEMCGYTTASNNNKMVDSNCDNSHISICQLV